MTRTEFDDYIKGRGSVEYRGRRYRAQGWQMSPASGYAMGYNFRVDDINYWFVTSSPEMLTDAYKYIADEEQLAMPVYDQLKPVKRTRAEIVPDVTKPLSDAVIKARKARKDGILKDV